MKIHLDDRQDYLRITCGPIDIHIWLPGNWEWYWRWRWDEYGKWIDTPLIMIAWNSKGEFV